MFKSMFKAIKKEWNVMIHEKMILLILIIIPLMVNILLGVQFSNNQIQHVPMVILDQDNSSISRMITQQFVENESFDVKYFVDTSMEVKKLMDNSSARVGMIVPKDFNKDITQLRSPKILMLYDGSHMSMASTAKAKASEILLTLKTGVLIKLLEGKLNISQDTAHKMALSLTFSNRTLYNPAKSFKNFLNPGFGVAIVQSAIALLAAVAIRKNEIDNIKRNRLGYILGKVSFYSIVGWISLMMSILIQIKIFNIPFRGDLIDTMILSFFFALSVSVFGILISAWIRNEMIATVISAILFVPSTIMVGYTWPILSMPKPYQVVATFHPFYHYVDNIRDLFLKGIPLSNIIPDILWFIEFSGIILLIAVIGVFRLKIDPSKRSMTDEKEGEECAISKGSV